MTVQQLIDCLEKVKNKNVLVSFPGKSLKVQTAAQRGQFLTKFRVCGKHFRALNNNVRS